jgi:signal transduction histidine kinase
MLLVSVVGVAGILGLLASAARLLDEEAAVRQRLLLESVIAERLGMVGRSVVDYAWWDDAYASLHLAFDADWADGNLGAYLAQALDIQLAVLVGPDDGVRAAWRYGEELPTASLATQSAALARIAASARAMPLLQPQPVGAALTLDGTPYLGAAAAITPFTGALARDPRSPRSVLVFGLPMDPPFLERLAQTFQLDRLRLAPAAAAPAPGAMALRDMDGVVRGALIWDVDRPGAMLLRNTALPVGAALALVLAAGAAFLRRTVRVAREREELVARLARERDAAQLAEQSKAQFLMTMSHELRTPLNAIIGFASLIRDGAGGSDPGHVREYARDIEDSGQRLLALVNDILQAAHVRMGAAELRLEPMSPASVVHAVIAAISTKASARGVVLREEVPADLPVIFADAGSVRQMLVNLVSNAVKFTPTGGAVTVSAAQGADGGVAISVADTGIGMTAEEIARATDAFWQAEDGPDRRADGAGLGLTLTKAQIEEHGGRLEIASTPGRGTTMTLRFPPQRLPEALAAAD